MQSLRIPDHFYSEGGGPGFLMSDLNFFEVALVMIRLFPNLTICVNVLFESLFDIVFGSFNPFFVLLFLLL